MTETATLSVSGMKCGGCESALVNKLSALDGVLSVSASHATQQVVVEFDATQVDLDDIEDEIEEAGYSVE